MTAIFLFIYLSFFPGHGTGDPGTASDGNEFAAVPEGKRGDARTCPVCAARVGQGDNVKSKIFPPSGRADRLLHISGCRYCLDGERRRLCPVCGAELSAGQYLVARIRDNPVKPEVLVQGCVHCISGGKRGKKMKKLR
ncbi:MAG: hypothetical protein LBO04_04425 [Spirochaetaceae bacterium]|nr:hypothetical protein [Spirochaetaceae bacterium]